MASPRLTEEEVHAACVEIAAQGERPTALTLLDKLGRGSLTTITKYLNTWNATDEAQAIKAEALPAVVKLPEELSKDGEDLLKRMWNIAKGIADEELDIQREALKQAEQANQLKVEEAFAFSEAQSMKIDRLEESLAELNAELEEEQNAHAQAVARLNEAEKDNVGLSKDNERLQHEISELKKQVAALEAADKAAVQEKRELQRQFDAGLKQKDAEIKELELQKHRLHTLLGATEKSNKELKTEIERKVSELSRQIIEYERSGIRYEKTYTELNQVKTELKAAIQTASDAEKLIANLQGQLEVYTRLENKGKPGNDGK